MKSDFNQGLEVLKKIKAEMKTAMESSTTQLEKKKKLRQNCKNRMGHILDRISGFEQLDH